MVRPETRNCEAPREIAGSLAYEVTQEGIDRVSRQYGDWVTTIEVFYCKAYQIDPERRKTYCGRALRRAMRKTPKRIRYPATLVTHDPALTMWRRLADMLHLFRRRGHRRDAKNRSIAHHCARLAEGMPRTSLIQMTEQAMNT